MYPSFRRGPGSPAAEAMDSKPIQRRFESDSGHFSFDSKDAKRFLRSSLVPVNESSNHDQRTNSSEAPSVEHNPAIREEAVLLLRQGVTNRVVAESLGVPRGTVGWWRYEDRRHRGDIYVPPTDCPLCTGLEFDRPAYAYLLGLYLGDGHITSKTKQHHLSISCDAAWTGLIDAAEEAMRRVMQLPRVSRRHRSGCVEVKSYSHHWTCLFPQHGPGKKHERAIVLEGWQRGIVEAHPWEFVRGLIHSDGCRITNWTVRNGKRYEYPRYFFTNKSDDIRRLCTDTLTALGIRWTVTARGGDPFNVSVARRDSVALMDARIGAKYQVGRPAGRRRCSRGRRPGQRPALRGMSWSSSRTYEVKERGGPL